MEHIKRQLKTLNAIAPDREFAARAKARIVGETRTAPSFTLPRVALPHISFWSYAGAGLTAMLLLVITAIPLAFPNPTAASLNPENLVNEYGNLPINIQLKEITYEQGVNQAIASALSEVSDTKMKHLNASLLKAEQPTSTLDTTTTDVDAMLQQIMN